MLNLKNYILAVVILLFCYPAAVKAGLAPSNDQCTNPIAVDVPSSTSGTTIDASAEGFPACGSATSQTSPGLWYTVRGTGNTITASTCNTQNFDTELSVWCGDCPEPPSSNCCIPNGGAGCDDLTCQETVCGSDLYCCTNNWDSICVGEAQALCGDLCPPVSYYPTCVAGNDDSCDLQSQVSWCSKAGATYRILVYGFGSATGDFDLSLTDDGTSCTPTVECPGGACEEAQQATQDAVDSGGPYRNHGKLVKTAAHAANQFDITEECHSCIVSQFARNIPIGEQEVCTDTPPPACCVYPNGGPDETTCCEPLASDPTCEGFGGGTPDYDCQCPGDYGTCG